MIFAFSWSLATTTTQNNREKRSKKSSQQRKKDPSLLFGVFSSWFLCSLLVGTTTHTKKRKNNNVRDPTNSLSLSLSLSLFCLSSRLVLIKNVSRVFFGQEEEEEEGDEYKTTACKKRSSVSHSFYELKNKQEITRNNNYGELPRKNASLLLRYDEREGVDVTSSSSSSSSSFLSPFCSSSSWVTRHLFFLYSRLPHFVFSRRERLLSLSIVSPPVPEPTVRWPR